MKKLFISAAAAALIASQSSASGLVNGCDDGRTESLPGGTFDEYNAAFDAYQNKLYRISEHLIDDQDAMTISTAYQSDPANHPWFSIDGYENGGSLGTVIKGKTSALNLTARFKYDNDLSKLHADYVNYAQRPWVSGGHYFYDEIQEIFVFIYDSSGAIEQVTSLNAFSIWGDESDNCASLGAGKSKWTDFMLDMTANVNIDVSGLGVGTYDVVVALATTSRAWTYQIYSLSVKKLSSGSSY